MPVVCARVSGDGVILPVSLSHGAFKCLAMGNAMSRFVRTRFFFSVFDPHMLAISCARRDVVIHLVCWSARSFA